MKEIFCAFLFFILFTSLEMHACTGVYLKNDTLILAGNNEDWTDYDTKMWFVPSIDGSYGRAFFGFGNYFPQGGMNEKGLFFDGFATRANDVVLSEGKPYFKGNISDHALATCSTVDEVVALFKKYNLTILENAMLMFGDAFGNSVIIEGDEFVFIEGNYQICTNFYQSETKEDDINCWRYLKAKEILKDDPDYSVELCKSILNSAHQKFTQYSNVYDLKKKKVYLYHFHDFENVVEIDLLEELKMGRQSYNIVDLFSNKEDFIEEANLKATPFNNVPILIFVLLSIFIFLSTPFVPIIIKRSTNKLLPNKKTQFRLHRLMHISVSLASVFLFYYLWGLLQAPHVFNTGMPENLSSFTTIQMLFIYIPLTVLILGFSISVYLFISYFNNLWTKSLRLYYSLVALLLIINLGLLNYWNAIKLIS